MSRSAMGSGRRGCVDDGEEGRWRRHAQREGMMAAAANDG